MAVAVDGTSPARWTGTPADDTDTSSASFTAPANALLVVCVNIDSTTSGDDTQAVVSDTGPLSWIQRVVRTGAEATVGGHSSIWTARTTSSVARTVGVQRNNQGSSQRVSARCYVLTGVDVDGTPVDPVDANNEGGSATNDLTTTSVTPGATGLLIVNDTEWSALGAFDASSDLTQDTAHYAGEMSVCSGYKVCTSGVGVTANLNAAAGTAQHKWCQIVVRESSAGTTLTPAPPSSRFQRGRRSSRKRRAS